MYDYNGGKCSQNIEATNKPYWVLGRGAISARKTQKLEGDAMRVYGCFRGFLVERKNYTG